MRKKRQRSSRRVDGELRDVSYIILFLSNIPGFTAVGGPLKPDPIITDGELQPILSIHPEMARKKGGRAENHVQYTLWTGHVKATKGKNAKRRKRFSLPSGFLLDFGTAPTCQIDFDWVAAAADDEKMPVDFRVIHCLVLGPGRDKSKIAWLEFMTFWLLVVPCGLGENGTLAGDCVDDGFFQRRFV